ncbi:serine/threonine-protein kinase [Allonocardiopsis opalescens]|uniref:Serine/threonine protein kinase n=1 Tax=Allonocardiopsis opalescens TaxID=1144618 RepID=A0A2T0Q2D3_9ACTN|nr:serine/threonine-protein kinase [Allonocardiopsis opalescens]PRX97959.1 serine/threonine protein kinase [Allonocardiopsis opalescens]
MASTGAGPAGSPLGPRDPRVLGPYQLLSRLGRGGAGTVYLARDPRGERVAVKVIHPYLLDDDVYRARLTREVSAARRVARFCTAPVLDARIDGDPAYVVTEYVEGTTLRDAVRRRVMRGARLEQLAVGVADALVAIHDAGVVHRDLTPANVMLSDVGIVVIDFGIARLLDTTGTRTGAGTVLGTSGYIAPETASGPATPASDIFAWGCLVAFAATGEPPFSGDTPQAALYNAMHTEPRLPGLDPGLAALVRRTLSTDPALRPTARRLRAELTGITEPVATTEGLSGSAGPAGPAGPVPAGPSSPSGPAAPSTRSGPARGRIGGRRRVPPRGLALGGAAAAALAVVAVLATWALPSWNASSADSAGTRSTHGPATAGPGPEFPASLTPFATDDFSDPASGWGGSDFAFDRTDDSSGYLDGRMILRARPDRIVWVAGPDFEPHPARTLAGVEAQVVESSPLGQYGLGCLGSWADDESGEEVFTRYEFLVEVADGSAFIQRQTADHLDELEAVTDVPTYDTRPEAVNRLHASCEVLDDGQAVRLAMWVNGTRIAHTVDRDPLPGATTLEQARMALILDHPVAEDDEAEREDVVIAFDDFEQQVISD